MRTAITLAIITALTVGFSGNASALPKVRASVGQGMVFSDGVNATAFTAEVVPSFGFLLASADLGLMYEMNKGNNFIVTPGVSVNLLGVYGRVGLPLRVTGDFDWGIRLAMGKNIFSLLIAKIFIELDTYLWHDSGFTEDIPLEFRLGAEFGF